MRYARAPARAASLRCLRCVVLASVLAASLAAVPAGARANAPFAACEAALRARPGEYESALCWFEVATATGRWEPAVAQVARQRAAAPANDWLVLVAAYLDTGLGREAAVATYREAARRFAAAGNLRGELLARGSLSLLLSRLGRTEQAAREVARVVALGARSTDSELRIRAHTVQARHLIDTGRDLERALHVLEAASAALRPTHPYRLRLQIHADLGSLTHWLGHYEDASGHFRRLESAATAAGDREGAALALLGHANARYEQAMEAPRADAYSRLLALAAAADAAARTARSPNLELAAAHLLAELQLQHAPASAGRHVARCLALAAQLDDPAARGECAWLQARLQARYAPALATATLQRAVAWQVQGGDRQRLAYAWRHRMHLSLATRPFAAAMADAEQALDAIEALRELQQAEHGRTAVLAAWSRDYYWLSGQLFGRATGRFGTGRVDPRTAIALRTRAFAVTERMRARALREAIARQAPPPAGARARSRVRAQLASGTATATLDAVRAALGPHEALLSFQLAPERDVTGEPAGGSWLLVLTRERSRAYVLPDRVQLTDMLEVYAGMRDTATADVAGRRLYEALLGRAVADLPPRIGRLFVVADGTLHHLPLATLPMRTKGALLGTRFTLSFVPSATLWLHWRRQTRATFGSPALVLADPLGDAATASASIAFRDAARAAGALAFARAEGADVLARLRAGSQLLTGAAAEAAALGALRPNDYAIVHFAAHAITDEREPARSALLLAATPGHDGLLQAHEIARMRWDGRVIVLSACTSAGGATLRGEGVLSLARGFFAGGARAVVGSLWRVRDDHARAFFVPFYRAVARGASVDEALQSAQQALRARGFPVAAWAAFQVYGDGSTRPVDATLRSVAAHHRQRVSTGFAAALLALSMLCALLLRRHVASRARVR